MKEFYTPSEIAELLNTTPTTIRRHLVSGKIKGTKPLGEWRISHLEFERLKKEAKG
jgi:excisionase family DNA binding protein